ncbi:hypothetical protein PQC38_gp067 [Aeromonas phage BUCT695]|nr:hypothetical protein PQC38_gp067 [Aeromonas phage BUCT695]UIW10543.1 hypothetical protein [Aeromonas phage BUCT695]
MDIKRKKTKVKVGRGKKPKPIKSLGQGALSNTFGRMV